MKEKLLRYHQRKLAKYRRWLADWVASEPINGDVAGRHQIIGLQRRRIARHQAFVEWLSK